VTIWATKHDAERLKIFLESRNQPVAGSETTDQEYKLQNIVTICLYVMNKLPTLTGVEATRL